MTARPLNVCLVEPSEPENVGSMGSEYIINSLRADGYHVDRVAWDAPVGKTYDVELVSVHHCTDFPRLAKSPRRGKIRIAGGHPSTNNWRPAIKYADAHCIGDGEIWVRDAFRMLSEGASVDELSVLPGTIITSRWEKGAPIPHKNLVVPIPKHPPYLNRSGEGHARVWYLEMSRGCPFKCHYCELGWNRMNASHQDTAWLVEQVRRIDRSQSNRISLFAPDEASHPGYAEVLQAIHDAKLVTSFGSLRLDQIMRKNLPLKRNMLIRVGLDGLTEATRKRVKKPIRTSDVVDYFRYMTDRGHANFKVFMVFGYPWEQLSDFDEFEGMMEAIRSIPRGANAHLRVKFTPLIPQPSTPLGGVRAQYDDAMVARIQRWFDRVARPWRNPGWYIQSDGIMSRRSHALQCLLTSGDEDVVDSLASWDGTETLKGYDA